MLIQTSEDDIPMKVLQSDSNSTDEIGEGVVKSVSLKYTDDGIDQSENQGGKVEFNSQPKVDVSRIGNLSFA